MNEKYEVSGHTGITVDGVTYPVGFAQKFVNGYEQGGKQDIMVQGLKYKDSKNTVLFEETEDDFPGTWWKVGSNDGKEAWFQIVTNWGEEKPSYWPTKIDGMDKREGVNFGMRLQFWVAERNIYYSTFIDFNYYYDELCRKSPTTIGFYA